MPIAAVPDYLKPDYSELPPGHKYGIFFPVWSRDWKKTEGTEKNDALKKVFAFEKFKSLSESLLARQKNMASNLGEHVFSLQAESLSPFMTGTGIEHPLENGFAFLAPYGLPYLAGSSVKGVLRRTAEYLRDLEFGENNFGWNQSAIDYLFGPESQDDSTARRGALIFWDVYIQPKDYKLGMDILTPHFTKYYEGTETPHESGQPVPVPFLVVPPEAAFNFNIQCCEQFIQCDELKINWRSMVKALLEHSFDWLGFGAKTASGYGQLLSSEQKSQQAEEQSAASLKASGVNVGKMVWKGALLKSTSAGSGDITIENPETKELVTGKFYASLSEKSKKRAKDKKAVLLDVEIEMKGNMTEIKSIKDVDA